MTSIDPSASPFSKDYTAPTASTDRAKDRWWAVIEGALERAGERLNPILVKEARQALKSKQFVITFSLLLLAGWVWSMLGVALLSPGVYYAPGGRFMLTGYFIVLTIPVLVIVPFSAFRSLAAEREDGTFELLSITSLSSRQIVTGKLGSATLQMLVYYSALAPCIAFTYLLRGIDIITIVFLLFYTFVASTLLSAFGLVVATLTRSRHWQVLLSVLLLIGLLIATYSWALAFSLMIVNPQAMPFDNVDFWLAQAAILTFCVSFAPLFVLIASAQISFASDNRSTRLRIMLLVQQVLWIGWLIFLWIRHEEDVFLFMLVAIAAIYWFVCGSFLTGETAKLSPRVRRSLPQSFLGRMVFTWFNPGSGTGYVFAALNIVTVVLGVLASGIVGELEGFARRNSANWMLFTLLCGGYVVAYLGAGRLLVLLLRQLGRVSMLLAVLVQIFLAVVGVAVPVFFQAWLEGYSRMSYSPLQATNWIWTLEEAADGSLGLTFVPTLILLSAAILFLLNLCFASVEIEQVRQATPERVLQDELELHPELTAKPKPRSPWDELEPSTSPEGT